MRYLCKPADQVVRAFLEREGRNSFSYAEVGASLTGAPSGYDFDVNRVRLGSGRELFERSCSALRAWKMFPLGWSVIEPAGTPIEGGRTVAVLFRLLGLWWLNAARIVYVLDEQEPVRRFGFAYGTLPGHVESGEERFSIEWLADDSVWYDLRAFSRPRFLGARLLKPLARRLQRRFVRASQAAMIAAARGGNAGACPS